MPLTHPDGWVESRRDYLAPLFHYLAEHHYVPTSVVRDACARRGVAILKQRVSFMKHSRCVVPPWLVEDCCQIIGKPIEEVMGAEWVARFGPDGRGVESGGTEEAPVGQVRGYAPRPLARGRRKPRALSTPRPDTPTAA